MASSRRLFYLAKHFSNGGGRVRKSRSFSVICTGEEWWGRCKRIKVLDSEMSYYDSENNKKETVIFLHGNPTSSYLWRNIIPHVENTARCLAPDLIGMGRSGKNPNGTYRFVDHYNYLATWFDSVELPEKVSIVCHDWGSALGFHWCFNNQNRTRALVHMESIVTTIKSWDAFPEVARGIFQAMRSESGEEIVLKKNFFVEKLLPLSIMRKLDPKEMEAYHSPFLEEGEGRRPTLTWPRQIPVDTDGPEDVIKIVKAYENWLGESSKHIPKLYIEGKPGFFSPGLGRIAKAWPNTKTVEVKGLHFLQEDSPGEIGQAIHEFLQELKQ